MSTTRFGYVLFTGNNRQSTNGLSNCLLRASSAGAPVKDNPVQCESRHWTARCTGNRTASRTATLGLLLRCERPVQAGQRLCSGAEVLRVHHSVASNLLNRLHYQAGAGTWSRSGVSRRGESATGACALAGKARARGRSVPVGAGRKRKQRSFVMVLMVSAHTVFL